MIADLGARLPPELGGGDRRAHLVPVAKIFDRRRQGDARHARGVVEDVADGHTFLAMSAKLRPELGDPGLVVEGPALGQHVDQGRGCRLADRVAVDGSVRCKQPARCRIRNARHGVDDLLVTFINRDLESSLRPGLDHLIDGPLNLLLEVGAGLHLAHASSDGTDAPNSSLT